jgi:hypothetical protein
MSTNAIVVAVATGLLCGCAVPRHPLEIGVIDDGFLVEGRALQTEDELAEAIRASGAKECRVTPGATTDFNQVEKRFASCGTQGAVRASLAMLAHSVALQMSARS